MRLQALLHNTGVDVAFPRVLGIALAGTFIGYVFPGLAVGYVSRDLLFVLVAPAVTAMMIPAGYLLGRYCRRCPGAHLP